MPDTIGLPGLHKITRWALILALGAGILTVAQPIAAQDSGNVQLPREAATTTETLEAIENLTSEIETNPSPEAYLALGLAHADLLQYDRALELFAEAGARYPPDSRFLAETANIHIAERNIDSAVEALERALIVDPSDTYAADLLASIRMSEGGVEEALAVWNSIDQPRIDNIFQNFSPGFLDRATPRGLTFDSGDVLTYEQWLIIRGTAVRHPPVCQRRARDRTLAGPGSLQCDRPHHRPNQLAGASPVWPGSRAADPDRLLRPERPGQLGHWLAIQLSLGRGPPPAGGAGHRPAAATGPAGHRVLRHLAIRTLGPFDPLGKRVSVRRWFRLQGQQLWPGFPGHTALQGGNSGRIRIS